MQKRTYGLKAFGPKDHEPLTLGRRAVNLPLKALPVLAIFLLVGVNLRLPRHLERANVLTAHALVAP